jgi:hypothetical protein
MIWREFHRRSTKTQRRIRECLESSPDGVHLNPSPGSRDAALRRNNLARLHVSPADHGCISSAPPGAYWRIRVTQKVQAGQSRSQRGRLAAIARRAASMADFGRPGFARWTGPRKARTKSPIGPSGMDSSAGWGGAASPGAGSGVKREDGIEENDRVENGGCVGGGRGGGAVGAALSRSRDSNWDQTRSEVASDRSDGSSPAKRPRRAARASSDIGEPIPIVHIWSHHR